MIEESLSDCHREGSSGYCGPECPVFIRGDCPIDDEIREEFDLEEDEDA